MKAAYDVGINFFDCAEGYAGGDSEKIMGEAIKKFGWKRNDIVISTKVAFTACPDEQRSPSYRSIGAQHSARTQSTTSAKAASTSSRA
jgi:aryl-alcohol dehydrogenase-like predicted oxidoreductase